MRIAPFILNITFCMMMYCSESYCSCVLQFLCCWFFLLFFFYQLWPKWSILQQTTAGSERTVSSIRFQPHCCIVFRSHHRKLCTQLVVSPSGSCFPYIVVCIICQTMVLESFNFAIILSKGSIRSLKRKQKKKRKKRRKRKSRRIPLTITARIVLLTG